ncbi:MAG: integrase core domain-containing protein [Nitrospira sp.]|nr:integrase core domain-containing protein [Nitrospira sp.]
MQAYGLLVEQVGWTYFVLVLNCYTKKIVGHDAGRQIKHTHWLPALEQTSQHQCPAGVQAQGLSLMSDNNPNGNTDIERLMRTLKEELLWLRKWTSAPDLERVLAAWVDLYNTRYLHSTPGYRRPCQFKQEHRATVKIADSLSILRATDQPRTNAPWLVPVWVGPDQARILACGMELKPGSSAAKHF